jgi:hypothetical protein
MSVTADEIPLLLARSLTVFPVEHLPCKNRDDTRFSNGFCLGPYTLGWRSDATDAEVLFIQVHMVLT